jgi:hypothetical protein
MSGGFPGWLIVLLEKRLDGLGDHLAGASM